VLDVGCGSGASLLQFMRLGFDPANLSGIDMSEERIAEARARLAGVNFKVADARFIPEADGSIDLVFESTMLGTLDDPDLLHAIARDMLRVTRPGGFIMLCDWRYSRKGSGVKTSINPAVIAKLFDVGRATEVVSRARGALVPPLGRRLSRFAPSLYFLTQTLLPFTAGQVSTVLRKLG
jgi:ubiquinone/menaquinone biosynthesis C-methylase UbiE